MPDEPLPASGTSARRWLVSSGKLVVAASLIAYLIDSGRIRLSLLAAVSPAWVAVTALCMLAALLLPCLRWWWLLRYQGVDIPLAAAVRLTWIGYFFSAILPGAASGDLARAYYLLKDTPQARLRAASTVLIDRGLGLYSLFFLGLVPAGILLLHGQGTRAVLWMGLTALGLAGASSAAIALLLYSPTRRMVLRVLPARLRPSVEECLSLYRSHSRGMLACLALSLLANACNALAFAPSARALGSLTPVSASFLVAPLVILANALPISPGGLGVAESASAALFGSLSIAHGAEMMLLLRIAIVLWALPGALLYVTSRSRARPFVPASARRRGLPSEQEE